MQRAQMEAISLLGLISSLSKSPLSRAVFSFLEPDYWQRWGQHAGRLWANLDHPVKPSSITEAQTRQIISSKLTRRVSAGSITRPHFGQVQLRDAIIFSRLIFPLGVMYGTIAVPRGDAAAVRGCSRPGRDWLGGVAARSQDAGHATSSGSPAQLGDTPSHSQFSCGDNRCDVDVGTQADCRLLAEDDTRKAETIFGSKDNGASCSNRLLSRLRDESPRKRQTSKTINAI